MISDYKNKIEVYIDDNQEPIAVYQPPARFELDTSQLEDGEHQLKFVAYSNSGKKSYRKIKFIVRNGPGITVDGLKENEIVEGKLNLLVNAYGGTTDFKWEPTSAETPSPIPSWIWVLFILLIAWAVFYFINQWSPSEKFANTPTYRKLQPLASENKISSTLNTINGADIYRKSCSSCHQENGQGLPNVFPPLNNSDVVKSEDPSNHIKTVLFGSSGKVINGVKYQTPMPAWADQLSDEEVAAVINHERSSWGNNARLITAEDIKKLREK